MKKIIVTIVVTIGLVGLIAIMRYHPQSSATVPLDTSSSGSSSGPTNYKNGTYTGSSVDVGYGIVQVAAVISGGKITNIQFLQMPNDRQRSIDITNAAEPVLKQETLQAQSANVDVATGATSTSQGYVQSLQAALNKAR